jgi:hypothetical protein
VTEALAQQPIDRVQGPESSPEDDADRRDQQTETAPAADATQASGSSPGPGPSAAPSASPSLASVLDPAPDLGTQILPATEGEAETQAGSALQPSAATPAGSPTETMLGAGPAAASAPEGPVGEAVESVPAVEAASKPVVVDEPAPDFGPVPAAEPVIVTRRDVSDAIAELGLRPVRDSALVPIDDTLAYPAGEVRRVLAPLGLGPVAATFARWDAPPPASSANAGGWAAPPAPARSSRFQRPGRLIAASAAQPSSAG